MAVRFKPFAHWSPKWSAVRRGQIASELGREPDRCAPVGGSRRVALGGCRHQPEGEGSLAERSLSQAAWLLRGQQGLVEARRGPARGGRGVIPAVLGRVRGGVAGGNDYASANRGWRAGPAQGFSSPRSRQP